MSTPASVLALFGYEHPIITHLILGQAAMHDIVATPSTPDWFADFSKMRVTYSQVLERSNQINREMGGSPLAIPQGVAELFASRLARKCGVRVPKLQLWSEARKKRHSNTDEHRFFKPVPGGWCVSARVRKSLPLYYLLHEDTPSSHFDYDPNFCLKPLVTKSCPIAREEYSDFPAEKIQDEKILCAVKWDSDQRLIGHAFRAFLYCSYAHSSNVLVDTDARLWHIDHAQLMYRADHSDLAELLLLVEGSERVMQICREISQLTDEDIKQAISDIPERFWLNDVAIKHPAIAYYYFATRLESWRTIFGR
jgi:hypothetical protein